jgi:hypothetical protein
MLFWLACFILMPVIFIPDYCLEGAKLKVIRFIFMCVGHLTPIGLVVAEIITNPATLFPCLAIISAFVIIAAEMFRDNNYKKLPDPDKAEVVVGIIFIVAGGMSIFQWCGAIPAIF